MINPLALIASLLVVLTFMSLPLAGLMIAITLSATLLKSGEVANAMDGRANDSVK